jgi:hypothetical protein
MASAARGKTEGLSARVARADAEQRASENAVQAHPTCPQIEQELPILSDTSLHRVSESATARVRLVQDVGSGDRTM